MGADAKPPRPPAPSTRPPPPSAADTPDDRPVPPELEALAAPHVESFDYFVQHGLEAVIEGLDAVEVREKRGERREES